MASLVQCDSCQAVTAEPRGGVIQGAPSDRWAHFGVTVWRLTETPNVAALGSMVNQQTQSYGLRFGPQPVYYANLQSAVDLCPACAARVYEAFGPAISKIARELPAAASEEEPVAAVETPPIVKSDEGVPTSWERLDKTGDER